MKLGANHRSMNDKMISDEACRRVATHTAASQYVQSLLVASENCGLDSEQLIDQSNLSKEALADPESRIKLTDLKLLWQRMVDQSGDCAIGLKIGENMPVGHWGLIEMLAHQSKTLEEAFECTLKYWRLITDTGNEFKLEKTKGRVKLSFVSAYYDFSYANEADMVYLIRQIKLLLGADIDPLEVQLTHSLPSGLTASDYESYFYVQPLFEKECNALTLPEEALNRSIISSCSQLKPVIEGLAAHKLKVLDESITMSEKVAAFIEGGLVHLDRVAVALNLSERTLQRRLKAEGSVFKDMVDDHKKNKAQQLLQEGSYTFQQISFLLGYKDERAFYDAVRRWFGDSPTRVARRMRG